VAIGVSFLTIRTAFRTTIVPATNVTLALASPAPDRLLQFASTISTWQAPSDFLLAEVRADNRIRFAFPALERKVAPSK
jgi:hypothetical protein